MNNKDFIITNIKTAFKTITPWKKRMYGNDESDVNFAYMSGWNACIKEIKKNRTKFMKMLEKIEYKE